MEHCQWRNSSRQDMISDMETGELLPSALSSQLSSGVLQSTGDSGIFRPNSAVASLLLPTGFPDSMVVSKENFPGPSQSCFRAQAFSKRREQGSVQTTWPDPGRA